ncbi:unnamed protein product [Moneuplotes crassus]|uniref:Uncharacterized protein n=1 Tax=Euplotes crassus TaxID=5936 RepID=A0AAD2D1T1_EUPCR|nr:unnamed protein product [Moneuplotes crassus]
MFYKCWRYLGFCISHLHLTFPTLILQLKFNQKVIKPKRPDHSQHFLFVHYLVYFYEFERALYHSVTNHLQNLCKNVVKEELCALIRALHVLNSSSSNSTLLPALENKYTLVIGKNNQRSNSILSHLSALEKICDICFCLILKLCRAKFFTTLKPIPKIVLSNKSVFGLKLDPLYRTFNSKISIGANSFRSQIVFAFDTLVLSTKRFRTTALLLGKLSFIILPILTVC